MDGALIFNTSLRYAHLRHTSLRGAILGQVDLTGADLGRACLQSAVLAGVVLSEATLARSTFSRARISHVDLTSCVDLTRVQLLTANLEDNVVVPMDWPPLQRLPVTRKKDMG